jgi:hypothetical protein
MAKDKDLRFGHNSLCYSNGGNGIPPYEVSAMLYDVGRLSMIPLRNI